MPNQIKAVIFDLNGVFIQSSLLSDRFNLDFGVSLDDFLPALKEVMNQVRLPGANPLYSYWSPYFYKWGVLMSEQEFYVYWFKAEGLMYEMIDYAKSLKDRGFLVFILSNNFRERAEYYRKCFPELNQVFDEIYYSWETGYRKPEKEAFLNVVNQNDLEVSQCVFFDDSKTNVEVAASLGIISYLFENLDQVKAIVG